MPAGPFVAIAPGTFPGGYDRVPPGGLCLSAFLFVEDRHGRVLFVRYDPEHPAWRDLIGLDEGRMRRHARGLTIPASHLKWGEDPRQAARRIGEDLLGFRGLSYSEPTVATEAYELERLPGEVHFDVDFFVEATDPPERHDAPPWWDAMEWHEPEELAAADFARGHHDVLRRRLELRERAGRRA